MFSLPGWYISCQSGQCHYKQRTKVIRETLSASDSLCKHLLAFRDHHRISFTPELEIAHGNTAGDNVEEDEEEEDEEEDEDVELPGLDKARVLSNLHFRIVVRGDAKSTSLLRHGFADSLPLCMAYYKL